MLFTLWLGVGLGLIVLLASRRLLLFDLPTARAAGDEGERLEDTPAQSQT
jgi:hypothetical protein